MLIVGSANTDGGLMAGLAILQNGGSALDAVEAVLRAVEDNVDDDSVGPGGLPNILGQVEQDASIMEGTTLQAGAVGAVKGFRHPISLARRVMERLPHVMLVGAGAETFAREVGGEPCPPVSEQSYAKYLERMAAIGALDTLTEADRQPRLAEIVWRNARHRTGGTANVIARDGEGRLCCGVTTSGWAYKYPGRLGDSPIIGAGNYADDRYGAAACTGLGEVTMRLCTAHGVVLRLSLRQSLAEAAAAAMGDIAVLPVGIPFGINLLAVDAEGRHTLWSTRPEERYYVAAEPGDATPRRLPACGLPS